MPLQVGAKAPGFALPAGPGELVDVGEVIGGHPVVLLFIPFAYSSVCTEELCTIAEDFSAYSDLGARVYGISVDSPFVTRKFAEECGAPFPILSDFNREVTRAYEVLWDDARGLKEIAYRSTFVIDTTGTVAYAWMSENPAVMPPFDEIKAALGRAAAAS